MVLISRLAIEKEEDERYLVVSLKFYIDNISLSLDKDLCIVCDICSKVCPKEAFSFRIEDGKASILLDDGKCVLCGACEPLCPTGAIRIFFNGKRSNILVDRGGFPTPLAKLSIDPKKCPEGGADAARACPRGAMKFSDGVIKLNEEMCLRCPWCEDACEHGAVKVNPLFLGRISIDNAKCSKGCDICAKICPTSAIKIEEGKAKVIERYCIFCNACSLVCKDGAITVDRYHVFVGDGFSSLWSSALRNLLSQTFSTRLIDRTSRERLRKVVSESRVF
ncbi:MAG: 4Fe-4S binding protein [Thermoproteota archaeon]